MARSESYGEMLRQARMRKGMDVYSVSRRLRIRVDILHAIEEADFAQLPPSGYTRNMVNAYARLVGLDPRRVSDQYLDELELFETGRAPASRAPINRPERSMSFRDGGAAEPRRPRPQRPSSAFDEGAALSRDGGRVRYSAYSGPTEAQGRTSQALGADRAQSGRGSAPRRSRSLGREPQASRPIGQYAPMSFSSPAASRASASGIASSLLARWPMILGAVVFVVLVAIIVALAFGGAREPIEDVPQKPISGLTDTSSQSEDDFNVATVVAPTSAVLTVTVADGGRSWVSVTVDGASDSELSEVLSGPAEENFTFTSSIRVEVGNPSPVTVQVDGKDVQLTKDGEDYVYTASFSDILAAWEAEHPTAGSSSSSSTTSASRSASSSSSSSSSSRSSSASS